MLPNEIAGIWHGAGLDAVTNAAAPDVDYYVKIVPHSPTGSLRPARNDLASAKVPRMRHPHRFARANRHRPMVWLVLTLLLAGAPVLAVADEATDYTFAYRLYEEGDLETAKDEFDLFVAQYPNSDRADDALYLAAEASQRLGRHDDAVVRYRRLLNDYPTSPLRLDGIFGAARSWFQQGKFEDSILALDEVLQRSDDPHVRSAALYYRGDAYYRLGDFPKAIEAFDKVLALHPTSPEAPTAIYSKGWAQFQLERYADAYATLADFLSRYPDGPQAPEAAYRAAESLFYAEQWDQASTLYAAFVEKFGTSRDHENLVADAELRIGQALFRAKRFAEAREQFGRVGQRYPSLDAASDAHYWAAEILVEQKRYNEAIYEFRRFLSAYPDSDRVPNARYSIGRAFFDLTQYAEAVREFEPLAEDIGSKLHDAATWYVAECRRLLNDLNTAVIWYRRVPTASSYYDDALLGRGTAYAILGDHERAAEAYAEVAGSSDSPLRWDALYQLGIAQFNKKDYAGSAESFAKFLTGAPEGTALGKPDGARYWLLRTQYERKLYADAVATARALISASPGSEHIAATRFFLAESLYWQQDYAGARAEYDALIKAVPDTEWSRLARTAIGWTHFAEGQAAGDAGSQKGAYDKAIAAWTRVADDPKSEPEAAAKARYDIGVAQVNLQNYAAASSTFEALISRFGESEWVDDARYMLAWTYYLRENYAKANEAFDELLRRHATSPLVPESILYRANGYFKRNQYTDAIREYVRVRDGYPNAETTVGNRKIQIREQAQYQIGESYYNLRDYATAIRSYRELQALYPSSPLADDAQYAIGQAYQLSGDTGAALDAFRTLVTQYPESELAPDALRTIGISYFDDRKYQQAIAQFQEVISRYPDSSAAPHAQYDIGRCYYELRSYPQSIQAFGAVSGLRNATADIRASALYFGAWVLRDPDNGRRDPARAIELLQQLVSQHPKAAEASRAYLLTAELQLAQGANDAAIKSYRALIDAYPSTEEGKAARVDLSNTLLRLKRNAEAIQAIAPIVAEPSGYPNDLVVKAQMTTGDAQMNLKRYDDAAKAYLVVSLVYGDDFPGEALQGLARAGDAYEKGGKRTQAVRWYERAVATYANHRQRTNEWKPFIDFVNARLAALKQGGSQ
ncbi:tetratricopeptide repeat protein [Candidatus Poribacteria bacterium]|nr:tetratricopeptide repeat protein [Candidatus Poribacteria bacterium]